MSKTSFVTADEYIGSFEIEVRKVLQKIRDTVLKAIPQAEEHLSYQMLAYKVNGRSFYVGAYKNHYSIFGLQPASLFEKFKYELSQYEVVKGNIKFFKNKPIPYHLIADMAVYWAQKSLENKNPNKAHNV